MASLTLQSFHSINMISLANINFGATPTHPFQLHSKRIRRRPHGLPHLCRAEPISITSQDRRMCELIDLYNEVIPYEEAWNWQKSIVKERKILVEKNEDLSDTVIILQHHPVFTLGTGSSQENFNFDINHSPYPIYRTERGGEVTYHGPGQLVMYPIINLRYHKMDLHWYLRALEEVVIRVLSSTFSIRATRLEGLTGVWVGDQKLAAIGIRVAQWITYHGLALNITTNLAPFDWIIPCGIRNRRVGSIKSLMGEYHASKDEALSSINHADDSHLMEITRKALVKEFSEVFQLEVYHQPEPLCTFLGQKQDT